MIRVAPALAALIAFNGCTGTTSVEEPRHGASPSIERLVDQGMALVPFTPPNTGLSYDEVVWPWEFRIGDPGWGSARWKAKGRAEQWAKKGNGRWHYPSTDPRDMVRRIHVAEAMEFSILDELKCFPEVRELTISTNYHPIDAGMGDALTVLRYCPYLTHLTIEGKPGSTADPPTTDLSKESLKAIGELTQLRVLRFYDVDVDDAKLKHLGGMKNLLFFDLNHATATSDVFRIIATWPRIRYVKLCGCNFDQPLNDRTSQAMESLVGRLELLWTNEDDLEAAPTKIHKSLEAPIAKIRANSGLARQPIWTKQYTKGGPEKRSTGD